MSGCPRPRFGVARRSVGATLVEAAFALPIFFLLFLGLVDFGLLAFNSNQVANAARDGARVGILDFDEADQVGSTDQVAIRDTILAKLPGQSLESLEVSCQTASGTPVDCEDADPEADFLRVKAAWSYDFLSPVANALGFETRILSGEAQMALVPPPGSGGTVLTTTTTTTPPCEVSGVTVSPGGTPATAVAVRTSPATRVGELMRNIDVTALTNGSPLCPAELRVEVRGPRYATVPTEYFSVPSCPCDDAYRYSGSQNNFWAFPPDGNHGSVVVLNTSDEIVGSAVLYLDQP